jgi:predicted chitinase
MHNREIELRDQDDMQQQREEIARVAYSYWQSRGCEDGHDVEDWLMAEDEVVRRRSPRREEYRREVRSAA